MIAAGSLIRLVQFSTGPTLRYNSADYKGKLTTWASLHDSDFDKQGGRIKFFEPPAYDDDGLWSFMPELDTCVEVQLDDLTDEECAALALRRLTDAT